MFLPKTNRSLKSSVLTHTYCLQLPPPDSPTTHSPDPGSIPADGWDTLSDLKHPPPSCRLTASAASLCLFLSCLGFCHILIFNELPSSQYLAPSLIVSHRTRLLSTILDRSFGKLASAPPQKKLQQAKDTEFGAALCVAWSYRVLCEVPHGCFDWSCLSPPPSVEASDWATFMFCNRLSQHVQYLLSAKKS